MTFGRTLRRWGAFRIGLGFRMKGATGWIMLLCLAMVQMMWYILLGTLWMLYGFGYLFFYLPIKWICSRVRSSAHKKKAPEE